MIIKIVSYQITVSDLPILFLVVYSIDGFGPTDKTSPQISIFFRVFTNFTNIRQRQRYKSNIWKKESDVWKILVTNYHNLRFLSYRLNFGSNFIWFLKISAIRHRDRNKKERNNKSDIWKKETEAAFHTIWITKMRIKFGLVSFTIVT